MGYSSNDQEFYLINQIIDSTDNDYINKIIEKYREKLNIDIPIYEKGKGLPIGNMTSQFLSIFYLNRLDHFIVHDLKCKYYVRYMDDFVIMHQDKKYLEKIKNIITEKLFKEYKLKVNQKKTYIVNSLNGFSYLGYNYRIFNNKIIIKISRKKLEIIKKKLKLIKHNLNNNLINFNQAFGSIMTYKNGYICNYNKINNLINRNFFDEK